MSVVHVPEDREIAVSMIDALRREAFSPVLCQLSRDLIDRLAEEQPDAVVVILDRAQFDAWRLCRDIRSIVDCGLVIACGEPRLMQPGDPFEIELLDAGADAVLPLAIDNTLLAARTRAAIRARPRRAAPDTRLELGDLTIDESAHAVVIDGREVIVRQVQFKVLLVLARSVGVLVSQERLLREVWNIDFDSAALRRLRIAISGLRRLLGEGIQRPRIESISRLGYRLVVPPATTVT